MDDLYTALVQHTKADVDRHGEAHIACPECGHTSSPRNPHCSFNERGFYCFVCGHKSGLKALAEKTGLETGRYNTPIWRQESRRTPVLPTYDIERMIEQFEAHRASWRLWQAYKPVSRQAFYARRLGVGVLPMSQCKHERLIVPIIDGTMAVGLRGRAINCSCPKWLAPAGTDISLYPLYNEQALQSGCTVVIVENPVDALLMTDRTDYVGVACYSTTYWQERWTEALKAARPELVVVGLDNDLVGNGGALRRDEFIRTWRQAHDRVPEPRGPALANRLLEAGMKSMLFDWGRAEYKADIGSLVVAGAL